MKNITRSLIVAAIVSILGVALTAFGWCLSGNNGMACLSLMLATVFAMCAYFAMLPKFER